MNQEELGKKRVQLARRISEVEKISFSEAVRKVPKTEAEIKRLVDRLNGVHGGDKSPDGQKLARATRLSRQENIDFSEAARRTK